jgi:hypothetical protein
VGALLLVWLSRSMVELVMGCVLVVVILMQTNALTWARTRLARGNAHHYNGYVHCWYHRLAIDDCTCSQPQ